MCWKVSTTSPNTKFQGGEWSWALVHVPGTVWREQQSEGCSHPGSEQGLQLGTDPALPSWLQALARASKSSLEKKKTVCIFWRRLISRLQIEFPSNWIRVYFYSGIKSGWNRTQWNMLILIEFCTLNIFKAKNSKQSLSEQRPHHQRAWESICAPTKGMSLEAQSSRWCGQVQHWPHAGSQRLIPRQGGEHGLLQICRLMLL